LHVLLHQLTPASYALPGAGPTFPELHSGRKVPQASRGMPRGTPAGGVK
jgi:hypothetical protein